MSQASIARPRAVGKRAPGTSTEADQDLRSARVIPRVRQNSGRPRRAELEVDPPTSRINWWIGVKGIS